MPWTHNHSYNNAKNSSIAPSKDALNLGKIVNLLVVFGIISLLTAWYFSFDKEQVMQEKLTSALTPPIYVAKNKETYDIKVFASSLPDQSWIFVEGEVLDSDKEYLFSFGGEMSRESGRDYEGSWSEINNQYNIKVTFPRSGKYYLKFKGEGNAHSDPNIIISVSKKNGSSLPHLWLGIITLIIAAAFHLKKESNQIGKFMETL